MGFRKDYFRPEPGAPPPLRVMTTRRVRFEEVDALGMVWHGRYAGFLEDARAEFGRKYGLSYAMFRQERIAAPIVQMQVDFRVPLKFDELFRIEAVLHWCQALRLNFEYALYRENGGEQRTEIIATASTVQLITDSSGELLLTVRGFLKDFRERWKNGELHA